MHFGGAVELWHPAFLFEASLEIDLVFFRQLLLVRIYQPTELVCGRGEASFSGFFGEKSACGLVQQVVLQAALFVYGSLQDGWSKVLVRGEDNEIPIVW